MSRADELRRQRLEQDEQVKRERRDWQRFLEALESFDRWVACDEQYTPTECARRLIDLVDLLRELGVWDCVEAIDPGRSAAKSYGLELLVRASDGNADALAEHLQDAADIRNAVTALWSRGGRETVFPVLCPLLDKRRGDTQIPARPSRGGFGLAPIPVPGPEQHREQERQRFAELLELVDRSRASVERADDSNESSANAPPAPRLVVDVDREQVTLDGETFDVASKQACRWLAVLLDNPGQRISSTELDQYDKELLGVRTDRLKAKLPPPIKKLLDSKGGGGTKLRLKR